MPKRRKTIEELAASGTLGKNSGRYAGRIAAKLTPAAPIGPAPRHLPAAETAVWKELTQAAPKGLLTRSDRVFLELVSRLVVRARNPTAKIGDLNALAAALSRLGFDPRSRSQLDIMPLPDPKTKSEQDAAWDELGELD